MPYIEDNPKRKPCKEKTFGDLMLRKKLGDMEIGEFFLFLFLSKDSFFMLQHM